MSGVRKIGGQVARDCVLCGMTASGCHVVGIRNENVRGRKQVWQWSQRIVLCPRCGFVFASPEPSEQELIEYYADKYPVHEILDYSSEKRKEFLEKHLEGRRRGHYLEIGANANSRTFHDSIKPLFISLETTDVNPDCQVDQLSLAECRTKQADVIAAYFVLEHIADVRGFLREVHGRLFPGGLFVVEVPDLFDYGRCNAGLAASEHVNHFTPCTLWRFLVEEKFRIVAGSRFFCSRDYGFVLAAERVEKVADAAEENYEAAWEKVCLDDAMASLSKRKTCVDRIRSEIEKIASSERPVVLWGASQSCFDLLADADLAKKVVIVDNDPRKKDFLPGYSVLLPGDAADLLREAPRLYLLVSSSYHKDCLSQAQKICGRNFSDADISGLEKELL